MTSLLLLLLCLLVLRALSGPAHLRRARAAAPSWSAWFRQLAEDVVRGARTLSRLDAARRDRLGRPWS